MLNVGWKCMTINVGWYGWEWINIIKMDGVGWNGCKWITVYEMDENE